MNKLFFVMLALATLILVGCKPGVKPPTDPDPTMVADPTLDNDPGVLNAEASGQQWSEAGAGGLGDPEVDAAAKLAIRDIHFAYDSAAILPNEAAILQGIAGFLKKYPQVLVKIEGHCDERGTEEYNMALGSRRANAAREELGKMGVEQAKLFTISYGEMRPMTPGHDEKAWAENRRGHCLVGLAGK